jgi:hypothetical protein
MQNIKPHIGENVATVPAVRHSEKSLDLPTHLGIKKLAYEKVGRKGKVADRSPHSTIFT